MAGIDDTDRRILELLVDDARRTYRAIGDDVGLSGPAVSDRVERLREEGVLEGFTVRLDRDRLTGASPVLVEARLPPTDSGGTLRTLREDGDVEAVLAAADGRVLAVVRPPSGPRTWVRDKLPAALPGTLEVTPLSRLDWSPAAPASSLARACDECGNTVTDEGVSAAVGGERHAFCCASCEARFRERYEDLAEGA